MKTIAAFVLLFGTSVTAFALEVSAPEIDGNTATTALALVSGGLLVLRGRRKK